MGSQPVVLIAGLDDGRTLYAVEREERGLYVLLQLGSWVNLQQLRAAAVVSKPDLSKASEKQLEPGVIPPAIPLITPEVSIYSKKKRLAIEAIQSMVKRPSSGPLTEAQPATTHVEPAQDSQSTEQLDKGLPLDESDITAQPTASEIFENVRNQYFEALYLSKACPTIDFDVHVVNKFRLRWLILQRGHYRGRVQLSISTMIRPLT
jgi:DNA replication regulator SLD3